jgi:3-phosphoshikimate 1-carboxyvinyltransferase
MTAPSSSALPDPYRVQPFSGPVDATVRPPGSKSVTNRALVAAALADGRSTVEGLLFADDTEAMLGAVARLGAAVEVDRVGLAVTIDGTDGDIASGPVELDARLSGTTSRFVLPVLALGPGPYRLDGGAPLRSRPMATLFDALRAWGVEVVEEGEPGRLPVVVRGPAVAPPGVGLPPLDLAGDVSSQFLSGLLLTAPCLPGPVTLRLTTEAVSRPYLDMTVTVMRAFGARIDLPDDRTFVVAGRGSAGGGGYRSGRFAVEPDASAASYLFAAATITGGRVLVEGLTRDSLQGDVAFVEVLERMGAAVTYRPDGIEVVGPDVLRGVEADFSDISDTAQTLAAVAVFAREPTRVTGIGFIRAKETDRIAAVVTELRRCGIRADEEPDGFVVHPGLPTPATVQTYDDHRMAMSFALLGLRASGIAIADPGCVAKTFPDYFDVLESLRPGSSPATDPRRTP